MTVQGEGAGVCPACPATAGPEFVEAHFDRVGGREYRVLRCASCGVVFSEPREAVGPEWYEKAAPIRAREERPDAAADWRYSMFFLDGKPPGRLLDVGCGDGSFLALAKACGFEACGFDYEERMVALARGRGIEDAVAAEFSEYCRERRPAEFDFITLFDVLEHVPEPGAMLAGVKRLLKPGGCLAVTLPNASRPIPIRREEHDYPPHHFTRWSPAAMRGFLQRNGFRVLRQQSSHLRVAYLADHFFFFALMPGLLRLAKLALFGRAGRETISELYAAGAAAKEGGGRGLRAALSDKLTRQRLVDRLKTACSVVTYPLAALAMAWYQVMQVECGDSLYTFARLERKE